MTNAATHAQSGGSQTKRAFAAVYFGHLFRYVYLLILIPFYGRVLGPAAYGRVLAALSLSHMVWMLVEYGFPTVGTRDAASTPDRTGLGAIYGRHVTGRLALLPAGLILGAVGTWVSPLLMEQPVFGVLATLNGIAAGFNLGWFFQGTLRFRTSVMLEVLGFAISLPAILLLVRGPEDAWLVLVALLVSSVVATAVGHRQALRIVGLDTVRFGRPLSLVRESTALFAAKGTGILMTSSSTYLVSLFASAAQVGWYGSAERLAGTVMSLTAPAQHVLVSTVVNRLGRAETAQSGHALIRSSFLVMVTVGVSLFAGTWLLASTVIPLLLGPEFVPAIPMLHVLALMFPFTALSQVIMSCIMIPGRLDGVVIRVSAASAIITVASVVVFGHAFGGIGAAWARAFGCMVMAALLFEVVRRRGLLGLLLGDAGSAPPLIAHDARRSG